MGFKFCQNGSRNYPEAMTPRTRPDTHHKHLPLTTSTTRPNTVSVLYSAPPPYSCRTLVILAESSGFRRILLEVADANETRFIQIKSQTKAQCWDRSDIADDKNRKVHLKKKVALLYKSVILLSFQLQTHQKKKKKNHNTTYSEASPSSEFLACFNFLCFLCTTG